MIPAKTYDKVGGSVIRAAVTRNAHDDYVVTGIDINDLAVLALRMNMKFDDPNELRDWQNRINLIVSSARLVTLAELDNLKGDFP